MRELKVYDPFERGLAAIALSEQAPSWASGAVPVLLSILDGPAGTLPPHVRGALVKIAPWAADEMVHWLVEESSVSDDCSAALIDALTAAGPSAVPAIAKRMSSPGDPKTRRLETIVFRMGSAVIDPLVVVLRRDPELPTRIGAAWILGDLRPPALRALPALADALEKGEPALACAAAESMQRIDPSGARSLPQLRAALAHPDPTVRAAAATAVTRALLVRGAVARGQERSAALQEIARIGAPAFPMLIEGMANRPRVRALFARECVLAWLARLPGLR